MADHKSLTRLIKEEEEEEEEEEEVEAHHVHAPRQIIRNCLTDALKKTMMDLESQLSAIVAIPQSNAQALSEFDKQLKKAEENFIEDVHMMEWTSLNSEMKKWNWIMKIVVRVYLASEKRLCEKILGEFGSFSSFCFLETTMDTMGCPLNFGVAIAIGARSPEKLFSFLDMYDVLANLRTYIDALFTEDAGCVMRNQFHEIVKSLGNLAKTTFVDFENVIASNTSASPFSGGGIHPLIRYVMNFIKAVTDYRDTLNLLLKDQHMEGSAAEIEFEDQKFISPSTLSPTSLHFLSIVGILKSDLESRSKLYHNEALQHIFMLNNLHYMVQKIKNTRLEILFGDEWIRTQKSKVQQHVKDYVRATWSSAVSLLRDDIRVPHFLSKTSSKNRLKAFTVAFEEVYKTQTGWYVPDHELREDLQISTSQNVNHAYRNFVERVSVKYKITDKYMKYTVDDLEEHLLDLFEGSDIGNKKKVLA
ncbi:hypothetical protein ACLB2K_052064 [Fragaria x ananassa]